MPQSSLNRSNSFSVYLSKSEPLPNQLHETLVVTFDILFSSTSIVANVDEKESHIYPLEDDESLHGYLIENGVESVFATEGAILSRLRDKVGPLELLESRSNMPLKLISETTKGQRFAFLSSTGTAAMCAARNAKLSIVGSLANLDAIAHLLSREHTFSQLIISCAGSPKGWRAIEDTWAAGKLTSKLLELNRIGMKDLAQNALLALELFRRTPLESLITKSPVARLAIARGDFTEVDYAFHPPNSKSIPILGRDGWIKNFSLAN